LAAECRVALRGYWLEVAPSAPPQRGVHPLVLLSHGSGVSPLAYITLAEHLATSGFIVGLPQHPFNNETDNSRQGTLENLIVRPRHLRAAIDWFLSDVFSSYIRSDSVSIIGHSLGAYTALALAGGKPTCFPQEAPDHIGRQIIFHPDHRVKALVLLAPATIWFKDAAALDAVVAPILILCGAADDYTPHTVHAKIVMDGVPDPVKLQCRVIDHAGHFSFMDPLPDSLRDAAFARSPIDFDRERFQQQLAAEIVDFLIRNTA
jgi:predicted dienelactone hydrolase